MLLCASSATQPLARRRRDDPCARPRHLEYAVLPRPVRAACGASSTPRSRSRPAITRSAGRSRRRPRTSISRTARVSEPRRRGVGLFTRRSLATSRACCPACADPPLRRRAGVVDGYASIERRATSTRSCSRARQREDGGEVPLIDCSASMRGSQVFARTGADQADARGRWTWVRFFEDGRSASGTCSRSAASCGRLRRRLRRGDAPRSVLLARPVLHRAGLAAALQAAVLYGVVCAVRHAAEFVQLLGLAGLEARPDLARRRRRRALDIVGDATRVQKVQPASPSMTGHRTSGPALMAAAFNSTGNRAVQAGWSSRPSNSAPALPAI